MKSKVITYSDVQLKLIKEFNCSTRASVVSKKQNDKITTHDVLIIIERQNKKCFYCNCSLKHKEYQIDHFYPKSIGGKTVIDNLVATCKWCNTMKNALDGHAFILKCKVIVENNHLNKLINN